jgi:hypothetical protein
MLRIKESYDCDNFTTYDLEMAKIIRKKNGKRKLVWVHLAPCDWHGRIKKTDPKLRLNDYDLFILGRQKKGILPKNELIKKEESDV